MRPASVPSYAANTDEFSPDEEQTLPDASESPCILLLQGPVGPFFSRVASDFKKRGYTVHKINFNGGDKHFYRHDNAVDYEEFPEEWVNYLSTYIKRNSISRIYLFGDCRFYHAEAKKVADSLGIQVYVFEEGYVRPNYITLELGGVNGFSSLMNRPAVVGNPSAYTEVVEKSGRFCFIASACYAVIYYLAASIYSRRFSGYIHHRPLGWLTEGSIWIRAGYRKLIKRRAGAAVVRKLKTRWQNQYFLCPLQVHCDMQVVVHSPFESIDEFICEVMTSFAKHSPKSHALVFKHHPLDRGYTSYKLLIDQLAKALHVSERVFYVHDVSLPKMLQNAEGSVMINSTVGMSSLYHKTPVKVMGEAVYDRKDLTFQGTLDEFWGAPGQVNDEAVTRFRSFLIRNNQLNGNLYRRCSKSSDSGIVWSGKLLAEHSPQATETDPIEQPKRVRVVADSTREAANTSRVNDDKKGGFSKSA